jgi:hypothetical protein
MMSRVASHNFWTSGLRSCIKSIWNKLHRFGLNLISVIPDCPWPRHMSLLNVIQLIFSDLRCIIIRFIICLTFKSLIFEISIPLYTLLKIVLIFDKYFKQTHW